MWGTPRRMIRSWPAEQLFHFASSISAVAVQPTRTVDVPRRRTVADGDLVCAYWWHRGTGAALPIGQRGSSSRIPVGGQIWRETGRLAEPHWYRTADFGCSPTPAATPTTTSGRCSLG
jgi:hypothetical protein